MITVRSLRALSYLIVIKLYIGENIPAFIVQLSHSK